MKEKKRISIILQVAILFIAGGLVTGVITYYLQHAYYDNSVKVQTEESGAQIAEEVRLAVREFPASDWLLNYWYEHHAELDIEYDVSFSGDTATEEKCRLLGEHYPNLELRYATVQELTALTEEDQKLYAEIAYSWLLTRVNQIKWAYQVDYLFCILTEEPYDRQFFLFSAADPGSTRGTHYEEVYILGTTVTVNESQKEAMRSAVSRSAHLADAGNYMDYYSLLAAEDSHVILVGLTYNLTAMRANITRRTATGTAIAIGIQTLLSLLCLMLLFCFVLRPLRKVQQNIRKYKQTKDSTAVAAVQSRNEIGQLSEDVVELAHEIDDYLNRIETITAERERIGFELEVASRIQANTIPNQFPPFPDRTEFDLFASLDPAREVSGDFYDFYMLDDDHLALLIADVSGKGVPAALFMMVSMLMLHNAARNERDPAKILKNVNEQICSHNPEEMFVSVWIGILELSTGKLTAGNAGHEYPVLRRNGEMFKLYKDYHDFVIGAIPDMDFHSYELQLHPGDKLFVYTDGLPESSDADKAMFGSERMLDALNRDPDAAPEQIIKGMQQAVSAFVKDAKQFDDLTMMCIEYKGPKGE